jgi:serine/threonine-protein kinase
MERGDSAAGVHWCRRLAALRPLDAAVTVRLMQALLASGDRAGALHQARIYEELISQELDLPPDEQVIDLARQIRDGRVAPASRLPPAELPPARTTTARVGERAERPAELSVAVIPWTTIGPSGHDDVVSDGLTEELLSTLARMPDLTVIAKPRRLHANTSVDAPLPLPDSATAVIEGSVRIASGRARVTARLVRLSDGLLLWSDRYERALDDVLGLERELASSIAEEVERALRRNAGLAPAPGRRERADALFEEGMRAWTPQGSGLGQGLERFRAAIAIDPEHARSHAALAESYTQLAFYGFLPSKRAAELVDVASREAMRLAPHLAESHVARGTSLLWVHRDFDAGTRELEHALELDPASVVAQARLAFVRLCHDGPMEAEPLFARRAATVPGATALSRVMYGQQFLAARRYDDAVEALHAAIDIEAPSFLAYHWLCVAYVQKGKGAEAVAAAVAEASISDRHPWSLASLIVACALAGQRRRAESLLATLTSRAAASHVQSSVLGIAHAALGDVDRGMSFLGRAVDEQDPSMMMLKWFPMFDPFRDHPRYRALLHRAGWRDWDTAEYPSAQRPPEHASRPGSRE